jgi:hypothetical protein
MGSTEHGGLLYAMAFLTSLFFAIGAFIPAALVLRWLFY